METQWYVKLCGFSTGPYPRRKLQDWLNEGRLSSHTMVYNTKLDNWKAIENFRDFQIETGSSIQVQLGTRPSFPLSKTLAKLPQHKSPRSNKIQFPIEWNPPKKETPPKETKAPVEAKAPTTTKNDKVETKKKSLNLASLLPPKPTIPPKLAIVEKIMQAQKEKPFRGVEALDLIEIEEREAKKRILEQEQAIRKEIELKKKLPEEKGSGARELALKQKEEETSALQKNLQAEKNRLEDELSSLEEEKQILDEARKFFETEKKLVEEERKLIGEAKEEIKEEKASIEKERISFSKEEILWKEKAELLEEEKNSIQGKLKRIQTETELKNNNTNISRLAKAKEMALKEAAAKMRSIRGEEPSIKKTYEENPHKGGAFAASVNPSLSQEASISMDITPSTQIPAREKIGTQKYTKAFFLTITAFLLGGVAAYFLINKANLSPKKEEPVMQDKQAMPKGRESSNPKASSEEAKRIIQKESRSQRDGLPPWDTPTPPRRK